MEIFFLITIYDKMAYTLKDVYNKNVVDVILGHPVWTLLKCLIFNIVKKIQAGS